jgi:hypothetical protein
VVVLQGPQHRHADCLWSPRPNPSKIVSIGADGPLLQLLSYVLTWLRLKVPFLLG